MEGSPSSSSVLNEKSLIKELEINDVWCLVSKLFAVVMGFDEEKKEFFGMLQKSCTVLDIKDAMFEPPYDRIPFKTAFEPFRLPFLQISSWRKLKGKMNETLTSSLPRDVNLFRVRSDGGASYGDGGHSVFCFPLYVKKKDVLSEEWRTRLLRGLEHILKRFPDQQSDVVSDIIDPNFCPYRLWSFDEGKDNTEDLAFLPAAEKDRRMLNRQLRREWLRSEYVAAMQRYRKQHPNTEYVALYEGDEGKDTLQRDRESLREETIHEFGQDDYDNDDDDDGENNDGRNYRWLPTAERLMDFYGDDSCRALELEAAHPKLVQRPPMLPSLLLRQTFRWIPSTVHLTVYKKGKIQPNESRYRWWARFKEPINMFPRNSETEDVYAGMERLLESMAESLRPLHALKKRSEYDAEDEKHALAGEDVHERWTIQVICKAQRYTLQPNQTYKGYWHREGMTERISTVIVYYVDVSEDIKGGSVKFCSAGEIPDRHYADYCAINPMESVATTQNGAIAFANCLPHRVRLMHNTNTQKTATRTFINMFIVDPNQEEEEAIVENVPIKSHAFDNMNNNNNNNNKNALDVLFSNPNKQQCRPQVMTQLGMAIFLQHCFKSILQQQQSPSYYNHLPIHIAMYIAKLSNLQWPSIQAARRFRQSARRAMIETRTSRKISGFAYIHYGNAGCAQFADAGFSKLPSKYISEVSFNRDEQPNLYHSSSQSAASAGESVNEDE